MPPVVARSPLYSVHDMNVKVRFLVGRSQKLCLSAPTALVGGLRLGLTALRRFTAASSAHHRVFATASTSLTGLANQAGGSACASLVRRGRQSRGGVCPPDEAIRIAEFYRPLFDGETKLRQVSLIMRGLDPAIDAELPRAFTPGTLFALLPGVLSTVVSIA